MATPSENLIFVRSARARHYRLSLHRDGVAVATIPLRGSEHEGRLFVERNRGWLERARARQRRRPQAPQHWRIGTAVLWRGELHPIRLVEGDRPRVCLAADVFALRSAEGDLRPALEAQFARRAKVELPARAWELAARVGADLKRVGVRNQR